MTNIHKGFIAAAALVLCQSAFGQNTFTSASAGNWGAIVAPDSIAAGFGSNFTTQTYTAFAVPLPLQLGGVSVQLTDNTLKAVGPAPLYMASQSQVNYLVPAASAVGLGTVSVTTSSGAKATGPLLVSNVAPAIFAANGNGMGVAAAQVFFYPAAGASSYQPIFTGGTNSYITSPFSLSPSTTKVYLVLYGTGIRRHSLNPVEATISGTKVPVAYAGPVASDPGLDQINIGPLPSSLGGTGHGDVNLVLTVDGVPANTVTVNIQ